VSAAQKPGAGAEGKDAMGEYWVTEIGSGEHENDELGLLRANASMLGNWESCKWRSRLVC
jgi:hypothetical protein